MKIQRNLFTIYKGRERKRKRVKRGKKKYIKTVINIRVQIKLNNRINFPLLNSARIVINEQILMPLLINLMSTCEF